MKQRPDERIQRIEEGNALYEIDLDCVEKRQKEQERERKKKKEKR